jgi:hypothetical protein
MKESSDLNEYMSRPLRNEKSDGNGEIGLGVMTLCFALANYTYVIMPENSPWAHRIRILLFICAALAPYLIYKVIKKFITWPRTGYVVCRIARNPSQRVTVAAAGLNRRWLEVVKLWTLSHRVALVVAGLVAGACFIFGFAVLRAMAPEQRFNAIVFIALRAALFAGMSPYVLWYWTITLDSTKEYPWKRLLLIIMVLGTFGISLIIRGGFVELLRPVFLFIGLVWLISGGATLFLFLRHTRPPAPEA